MVFLRLRTLKPQKTVLFSSLLILTSLFISTLLNVLEVNLRASSFYIVIILNILKGDTLRASQVQQITQLTGFNPNRDTVVITHGWRNYHLSPVNREIRTALLSSRNVNVIVVDWSGIADQNYVSSQGSVLAVGNFVGDFLIQLNNQYIGYLNRITLVGHSLGAHVAGKCFSTV